MADDAEAIIDHETGALERACLRAYDVLPTQLLLSTGATVWMGSLVLAAKITPEWGAVVLAAGTVFAVAAGGLGGVLYVGNVYDRHIARRSGLPIDQAHLD